MRKPIALLAVIITLTLLHWAVLALNIPLLELLPYWHWKQYLTPLPMWWILPPLAAIAGVVVHRVLTRPQQVAANVALLILLGYCIQFSFGHMPGLGMYGLTSRMTQTDHAAFAKVAARRADMSYVLRNYYELIKAGELSPHPHSTKPPGQLLFYMLTEHVSRVLLPGDRPPLDRLTLFAALTYPLLTYLVLIPLYFLSRLLLPKEHALLPLLLYVFVPNTTLMTLHLDQCLYPLLFVVPLCLFLYGLERRHICLCFLAGLAACMSMFVSFSLVPLLAFPFIYTALAMGAPPGGRSCAEPSARPGRRLFPGTILYLLGFACGYAFLRLAAGYSAVDGYMLAMARHHGAKITDWTCGNIAYVGVLDIIEFTVWIGMPLFVLFAADQVGSLLKLHRRKLDPVGATSLSLLAIVLLMAFAGRTVAETGRLWLFVVPLFCLSAAAMLPDAFEKRYRTVTGILVALQLITVLLMKAFHDFY
ncbi:hypothetical protein ACFLQU_03385 [Verrucomicrobiota bacterium]